MLFSSRQVLCVPHLRSPSVQPQAGGSPLPTVNGSGHDTEHRLCVGKEEEGGKGGGAGARMPVFPPPRDARWLGPPGEEIKAGAARTAPGLGVGLSAGSTRARACVRGSGVGAAPVPCPARRLKCLGAGTALVGSRTARLRHMLSASLTPKCLLWCRA